LKERVKVINKRQVDMSVVGEYSSFINYITFEFFNGSCEEIMVGSSSETGGIYFISNIIAIHLKVGAIMTTNKVPARISSILINALKGGVVPRVGLEYVTVGRAQEIAAILHDIDLIEDGAASLRFVVGKYGSGKSFLLQTIRNYATAKGFAVVDADLSPERRFAGTKGQGLATYKELLKNLSTKSKPDG
jgi:hypothetical protein